MSEDLFSQALQNKNEVLNLELPKDDIDVDEISDSDSESGKVIADSKQVLSEDSEERVDSSSGTDESSDDSSEEQSSSDDDSEVEGDQEVEGDEEEEEEEEEEAGASGPIRSKHELTEEPLIEIPDDYKVDPNTNISEAGSIQSLFENNVIIHSNMSGERRVLKEGSIFCLEDRNVIGTLSEVFGPLQNPFYRVSFKSSRTDIKKLVEENTGKKVYIVVADATWVDTFELKRFKGTDASNNFDEELPEEEQEFSDDEQEALFKKKKKADKKRKKNTGSSSKNVESQAKKPKASWNNSSNLPQIKPPMGMVSHGYKSRNNRESNQTHRNQIPNRQQETYQHSSNNHPALQQPAYNAYQQQSMPMPPFQQPLHQFNNPYGQQPMPMANQFIPPQPQYPYQQHFPNQPPHMGQSLPPHGQYNGLQPPLPQPQQQQQNLQQVYQLHQLLMQQQQQQSQQHNHPTGSQPPHNDAPPY
ncbi:hypothetical protein KAFR_0J02110 [Kazachstania africana CBS 2517]|uniref:H/ACA ribonucleoprotein complex non-core subunit NAF1 n=1 Tax=Kazachstania africana (strain ATCC 22294 / BCRC 22015 / CBS 2517 / CECT 1963 / NBRC 1671 / NRRL Y-8276) TaxID=1071382 RepID=H2B0X5_KAZAF|nr:hypothetical protein KAFR_0J02110 [Kazachstania africana CBS 2517]CCF60275.1 hypothetical protein KAFR_0J02110 [Kazachstania africana CBS 2517]